MGQVWAEAGPGVGRRRGGPLQGGLAEALEALGVMETLWGTSEEITRHIRPTQDQDPFWLGFSFEPFRPSEMRITHIHTHTHSHKLTHSHTHSHTLTHTYTHSHTHTQTLTHTNTHTHSFCAQTISFTGTLSHTQIHTQRISILGTHIHTEFLL